MSQKGVGGFSVSNAPSEASCHPQRQGRDQRTAARATEDKREPPRIAAELAATYRRAMMTPAECIAARLLLQWTQLQLAEASGADVSAIRNFEDRTIVSAEANVEALRRALEAAGVRFVSAIGSGSGVRLERSESNGA